MSIDLVQEVVVKGDTPPKGNIQAVGQNLLVVLPIMLIATHPKSGPPDRFARKLLTSWSHQSILPL